MRHSQKQKAALKHALHRPRELPEWLRESPTTSDRLFAGLVTFALGVFFGWLLAGCPGIWR